MKDYGPPDNPFPELPPAASLYAVHWPKEGPPPTPAHNLVMGLQDPGGNNHFASPLIWTLNDLGGEDGSGAGSATVRGPGFANAYGVMTLSLVSFSGSNIFGVPPVDAMFVGAGHAWSMTLSGTISLGPAPPGFPPQTAVATYNVVSLDLNGRPSGTLLSITLTCESGDSQSLAVAASGVAPK